jgi:putative CocE/NonD family hydrolase
MSDGICLSADLYLPESPSPVGAAIEYLPYRKDDLRMSGEWRHRALAAHGIAAVRMDVRGTGSSDGQSAGEYSAQEQEDALTAMEWLAQQSWSNGRMGLWGSSYGGFNSLQIASQNPEQLKAIVAIHFTDDRYTDDVHYGGGVLRGWDRTNYALRMIAMNGLPPDPDLVGRDWSRIWNERLGLEPWTMDWIRHQTDSPYWRHGSISEDYSRIKCATYLIGGWADGYRNAPFRTFESLTCPKKLLMGPWSHNLPDAGIPGPHIDFVGELARWFGYWLNDTDTEVVDEHPVTIFVSASQPPDPRTTLSEGYWLSFPDLPRTEESVLTVTGPGTLETGPATPLDQTLRIPDAPYAGVWGGVWCPANPPRLQASDQRREEPWSLIFSSQPLSADLCVLGYGSVALRARSQREVAQVAIKVCDVAPDGQSTLVTRGVLNLTRREGMADPLPLTPGEAVDVIIPLDNISWVFPAGHMIRLLIAASDWPNVWPPPQEARLELLSTHESPISLALPITELNDGTPVDLSPPNVSHDPGMSQHRDARWLYQYDAIRDVHEVRTESSMSVDVPAKNLRIEEKHQTEIRVNARDQANASATGSVEFRLDRPSFDVVSRGFIQVSSNRTHFRVIATLEIDVASQPYQRYEWTDSIPRALM